MSDKIAFLNVIKVIEQASKKELNAIAKVEKAILQSDNSNTGMSNAEVVQKVSKRINPRTGKSTTNQSAVIGDKPNQSATSDFNPVNSRQHFKSDSLSTTTSSNSVQLGPQGHLEKPSQDSQKTTTNEPTQKSIALATTNGGNGGKAELTERTGDSSNQKKQEKTTEQSLNEQVTTNSYLEGLYRDSQGQLRQKNGAFASRKQKEEFASSEKEKMQDQGGDSLISKLSSWVNGRLETAEGNKAIDGAGTAVGSSFWMAAKEVKDLATDAKSLLDNNNLSTKEGITGHIEKAKSALTNPKETVANYFKTKEAVQSQEPLGSEVTNSNEISSFSNKTAAFDSRSEDTAKANRDDANKTDPAAVAIIEQTKLFERWNAEQADLLKEVSSAVSASNSGGGIFGDDGIDLDRKKGKKKRRRSKLRNNKPSKMKSVLSTGGEMASSVMSKGAGVGSKLMGGLGAAAKGAGRFVPFLAPALAAYEAVSGFTDTEKQKETFNLKDGQEATTGQKSSMALASVLDMGGLVSGAAGLIGSGLGALGLDGAKDALSFDSGSMAKGIYSLFGGESESVKEKITTNPSNDQTENKPEATQFTDEQEKEFTSDAKNAERIKKGNTRADRKERSDLMMQQTNESIQENRNYVQKHNVSYDEARTAVEQQKVKKESDRKAVALDMGQSIDGKVDHGEGLISPKKKAAQVAIVDKEITRRNEVNELAKNGDYRNNKFINPIAMSSLSNIGTTATQAETLNAAKNKEQQEQAHQNVTQSGKEFSSPNVNSIFNKDGTNSVNSFTPSKQLGMSNIMMPGKDKKEQPTVIIQSDPALIKTMDELLKVTKTNGKQDAGSASYSTRTILNNQSTSQNKATKSNIPTAPVSMQMQAIAADRD
ncbi:hypothetical protein [Aliivibrio salmonicida]|uniref:hypothetical protein n=1 Tax=Aliivibrio salmonicida TaxID=40269 RepID=UPI003D0EA6AE